MKNRRTASFIAILCIVFIALTNGGVLLAFETDQYNLPPEPLADTSEEVEQYISDNLYEAVAVVNGEIARKRACIAALPKRGDGCGAADAERNRLAYLQSNDAIARELYSRLGTGDLFVTSFGNWWRGHQFKSEHADYKAPYKQSIYVTQPLDYATISPTVRLYGVEFGLDKLEHFFQQGHKYYSIRRDALAAGKPVAEAEKKAVKWGKFTEKTYFGMFASGVFSNADLYSNYAGMKFYAGLTTAMEIDGKTRPATATLVDGLWSIDPASLHEDLLKPFISEHLNEAVNLSGYAFNIAPAVRRSVKRYACPEWKTAFPTLTADELNSRMKNIEKWNGEDYGYSKRSRTVSVAEMCFGSNP